MNEKCEKPEEIQVMKLDILEEFNSSGGPANASGSGVNPMSTRELLQQVLASSHEMIHMAIFNEKAPPMISIKD